MIKYALKIRLVIAQIVVCCLFFLSCTKNDDAVVKVFNVSVTLQKVSAEEGEQIVKVKCGDNWTLSLNGENGEVDWARLNVSGGVGNKTNVRLSYDANEGDADRVLTIILRSGSKSVSCTMTQLRSGVLPEPGEPDSPNVPADLKKAKWIELPAMNDPNLEYYSYSFSMNGEKYRNYTFGWSQKDYTTVWVAYPLWSTYTNKGVDRTNKWAYDPTLGPTLSPAPFDGYAGNYDRGHLLPSADLICCYDANVQTFYSTNIVPQEAKHNQVLWESLEGKIRTIANGADSTYIVTGVMIKNPIDYTTDSTKDEFGNRRNSSELKTLPVPSHFFKAVLRYGKASTFGQWNAAGFYYKHESNAEQQLVSIDKLEELTGLDFFVNLASVVGEDQAAKIEASAPNTSIWQ